MIFTGFHPNATRKDMRIALSYLLLPWKWSQIRDGKHIKDAENALKIYFDVPYAKTFDSGRTALQKALEALEVKSGDEILVQGYTCMVVSNAIVWSGGTPVYVDIQNNYNIDSEDLEKKITKKSKVLIIQHTFGTPANLEKLLAIAKKYNLKVIEDCAHSLGAKYKNKRTGMFGDIGMLSFGTDKVISCVRGGALITSDETLASRIDALHSQLSQPPFIKTIQYLKAIPLFLFGKKLYDIKIGKIILAISKKFRISGQIIYKKEMIGERTPWYPAKLANALAEILINQLHDLDNRNTHRKNIAEFYRQELIAIGKSSLPIEDDNSIWLRFPLQVKDPKKLMMYAKKRGILLGDWYNQTVAPHGCNVEKAGYKNGSCPRAENMAHHSINLPTNKNITQEHARYIVQIVKNYVSDNSKK